MDVDKVKDLVTQLNEAISEETGESINGSKFRTQWGNVVVGAIHAMSESCVVAWDMTGNSRRAVDALEDYTPEILRCDGRLMCPREGFPVPGDTVGYGVVIGVPGDFSLLGPFVNVIDAARATDMSGLPTIVVSGPILW